MLRAKAGRYSSEIGFCFKVGANPWECLRLAAATVQFHLANAWGTSEGRACAEPKPYRVKVGRQVRNLWLRVASGDFFVFHEVFLDGCYAIPSQFRQQVKTVVDLGAHVGLTTHFFASMFPRARYVCVEPNPLNGVLLRKNLAALGNQVCVVDGAVGGRSGTACFDLSVRSWEGRIGGTHGHVVRVYDMREIMSMCNLSSIDLLKVDVEGAEREMFRNGGDWLGTVRVIVIELHGGYSVEQFEDDVRGFGFRVVKPDVASENKMILAVAGDRVR